MVDCLLQDNLGGVIGASRSTGANDEFTNDSWAIPVNGGFFVAAGDTTKSISLWCRQNSQFDLTIGNAQMMVVNIQGFN